MSIQSEINRLSGNITNALVAIASKGVTVPSDSNSDDLATLIDQISGGGGSGGIVITDTADSHGGVVREVTAVEISGTKQITQNGTGIDVTSYAAVDVAVPAPAPSLQAKTNIDPTESSQTIQADNGYDGLSSVQINAISSSYVGSGIIRRSSSDLTTSGATVSVPSGYYAGDGSKTVVSGTAGTPTATKGTVSNHSVSVTPSVTNTSGYIEGSTKTGTAVTVSASELVSGSETKTSNGTYDVTNLAELVVNVGKTKTGTFTGTGSITVNIANVDFEPDLIFIYGDLTGSSNYRGVSTLVIIRDTIVLQTNDASSSSTSESLQLSKHGISGLNEASTTDTHATYSGTTLTITTVSNTTANRFNSSITYNYKLLKWTA